MTYGQIHGIGNVGVCLSRTLELSEKIKSISRHLIAEFDAIMEDYEYVRLPWYDELKRYI